MNHLVSLDDQIGKLVHPDARAHPIDFASHKAFIATRLGLSLGSLALAPLCFVAKASPTAWEAWVLAWLILPFAAVVGVSRSGRLLLGEALSMAAWIGLAVSVTIGTGSSLGLALLLMVPVEASAAMASPIVVTALATAIVAAGGLALRSHFGFGEAAGMVLRPLASAAIVGGLCYGGVLALIAGRLALARKRLDRANHETYRAFADIVDDVVVRFDLSGAVREASPASGRVFGIDPRDLMGRGFFERLHVADRPKFLKLVTDVAASRQARTATLRLRTGRIVQSERGPFNEPVFAWIDLAARMPAARESGGLGRAADPQERGVVGIVRDATVRCEQEQAIEQVRSASDRNNAGRDLFLANISHELRTPLNAIIGFSEILSNASIVPDDPAKQREYAAIIHSSGHHLLAVVNTILDASKIESGRFDIFPEPFDIGGLIHLCCDMVGLKAEQSRVELVRHVAPGGGEIVGDKRACKQVVLNLLSNALKFTPAEGRVTIDVRPDGTSMLITVSDTGIGVSPRDLPKLGDPFFQARSTYDRAVDGTGLGLSVVRGLVGLHGGHITIESTPGQGTSVMVRLPLDCRRSIPAPGTLSKIETISRYGSSARRGDMPGSGKVHKIA